MNALLLAVALAAAPGFEGELTMRLDATSGSGTVKLQLGQNGLRSDVEGAFLNRTLKTAVLVRLDDATHGVALDLGRKTYQRFSLAEASEAMRPQQSKQWRVERLGRKKVLDFSCEHVRVSDSLGFTAEYWVSREVLGNDALAALINRAAKQPSSVEAELHKAGVGGLVLKMEQQSGADRVSLELTKAVSKPLPADALDVPADYRETPSAVGNQVSMQQLAKYNQLSDEQKKQLSQKLRDDYEQQQKKR